MKNAQRTVLVTFVAAVLAVVASFIVPRPHGWQFSTALYYETLTLTSAFMCLLIGSVVLLLMGASAYKAELRRAYLALCIGILCVAVGCVQLPILSIFNWWASPWVSYGGIGVPFFLAGIVSYAGARSLALLIGRRGPSVRYPVVMPAVLLGCVVAAFIPHVKVDYSNLEFAVAYGIFVWSLLFLAVATYLLFWIKRHIGVHYIASMAWLFAGVGMVTVALAITLVSGYVSNKAQDNWSVAIDTAGLIAGLVLVRAGYVFTKTRDY